MGRLHDSKSAKADGQYRIATIKEDGGAQEKVILCDDLESLAQAHNRQIEGGLDYTLKCVYNPELAKAKA